MTNAGFIRRRDMIEALEKDLAAERANTASLKEAGARLGRELEIELERATHYREAWQNAQLEIARLRAACEAALPAVKHAIEFSDDGGVVERDAMDARDQIEAALTRMGAGGAA